MGEITEIVNAGVSVVKLVANHAGSHVDDSQFATGLPHGVTGDGLSGWQFKKVGKHWKQTSDWYEFWNVDWDYTVGMKWAHHGSDHGKGKYVDQITITLDVVHIPPDFTLDVTAHFPKNGLNAGTDDDPIGALQFTTTIEAKGFLGQLVSWSINLDCLVQGDGTWQMNGG